MFAKVQFRLRRVKENFSPKVVPNFCVVMHSLGPGSGVSKGLIFGVQTPPEIVGSKRHLPNNYKINLVQRFLSSLEGAMFLLTHIDAVPNSTC